MRLILFDVDGTLINTGGAGGRAFSRAMEKVCGVPDPLKSVRLDGKTDHLILREALAVAGRQNEPHLEDRLFQEYVSLLEIELASSRSEHEVLPGVLDLLERLEADSRFILGLGTGNVEPGARAKLEPGGLNRFFGFGGFGSDHLDRTELIKTAIERGLERDSRDSFEAVIVIGDTPRDIIHGHEAGAAVLAVSTGSYSLPELKRRNPEWVLTDLKETELVMDVLGGSHS
jgi:phosphoglycolate phosphatase-like HAD superfamily hydrolase